MTRNDLLKLLPKKSIGAELGVCDAEFSQIMLDVVDPSRLYLVDVWKHIELGYRDRLMTNDNKQTQRYRRVMKRYLDDSRVSVIRDYTSALAELVEPNSLDWIYIDADHSFRGCWQDLEIADRTVKPNGIIMGHDYNTGDGYGVIEAVDRFVKEKGYFLTLVTDERAKSYLITRDIGDHEKILQLAQNLN